MRKTFTAALFWSTVLATQLRAQGDGERAAADSAAVARASWGRAAAALEAGDLPGARRELAHATSAWPLQTQYLFTAARLAARASDTTAVLAALSALAELGLGRDVRADRDLAAFATLPHAAAIVSQLDRNRAPFARSTPSRTLADSAFWPEGVDADVATGTLYVASVRYGVIAAIGADGSVRELGARNRAGVGALLGVRYDAARKLLWATTSDVPQARRVAADSNLAALLSIDPSDGRILRRWDLPPNSGHHTLGDLAVGPAGDVFFTDSDQPWLYRLRPGADSLERLTSPLFRSLQGIAPSPDVRHLVVADYSHGLLRVELESRRVTRIADAPRSTTLGIDGLSWDRGAVIAIQNGVAPARVMRFTLDAERLRVTAAELLDRNIPAADEPTIGTVMGDRFVYVANSSWEKYDASGERIAARPLARPLLLALRLP